MIYVLLALALIGLAYMLWENTHFVITNYEYKAPKVPREMNGLRLLQISDLHNQSFGKGNRRLLQISDLHNQSFGKENRRLLEAVRRCEPDGIMITGDLIDSTFTDTDKALTFAKALTDIAPVYYCTGNHEHRLEAVELERFLADLEDAGVCVLWDRAVPFYGGTLAGLQEPSGREHSVRELIRDIPEEDFVLLLSHKPHYFEHYLDADLVLTGHAHGGQVRLPWIGGLFAPGQSWFPKYTEGFYTMEDTTMLVSRGAGNSHRIPRVFNFPELVLLTLRCE